eukprot:scaffold10322_cov76-Skeletonema_dohrnii-CCMP3373.AAC.3
MEVVQSYTAIQKKGGQFSRQRWRTIDCINYSLPQQNVTRQPNYYVLRMGAPPMIDSQRRNQARTLDLPELGEDIVENKESMLQRKYGKNIERNNDLEDCVVQKVILTTYKQ